MDIRDVKKNLNRKVRYKSRYGDSEYILNGCTLRRHKRTGAFYYQVELQDIKHDNCLVYVGLEDVEEIKEEK